MSGLLDEVLAAHGGLERWRAVTALTAHGAFGGLLRARFPGNQMANVTVRVQVVEQHAVFRGFPRDDQRAVFDRGDVRIETDDVGSVATSAGTLSMPRTSPATRGGTTSRRPTS